MISIKSITSVHPLARLAFGVGLLAAACGNDTLQPLPVTHVTLALRVEAIGTALDPRYRIVATVTNDGNMPVLWWQGPALTRLRDPAAQFVKLNDCGVGHTDQVWEATLAPGQVLSESYSFTGMVCDELDLVDAPPGTYTVYAQFTWLAPGVDEDHVERAQETFEWPAVTASRPLDG
jgi:hypothetical protein